MNSLTWKEAGELHGWTLPPPARWWWRLPVIRHVRAIYHAFHIVQHEDVCRSLGTISTGYDEWVLAAIWRGDA